MHLPNLSQRQATPRRHQNPLLLLWPNCSLFCCWSLEELSRNTQHSPAASVWKRTQELFTHTVPVIEASEPRASCSSPAVCCLLQASPRACRRAQLGFANSSHFRGFRLGMAAGQETGSSLSPALARRSGVGRRNASSLRDCKGPVQSLNRMSRV